MLQAAEASYQETKTTIENLGAVNPTAWTEFQEAQQRHDFLTAQRQDVLDSIRDTEKSIQEIEPGGTRRQGRFPAHQSSGDKITSGTNSSVVTKEIYFRMGF